MNLVQVTNGNTANYPVAPQNVNSVPALFSVSAVVVMSVIALRPGGRSISCIIRTIQVSRRSTA